jgi:spore germination protein KC
MKKVVSILLLIVILTGVTGCWSAKELSEIAITAALGIDKAKDGYRVSVQLINPGEITAQKQGSGLAISVYSAEGRSIMEAIRKLTTTTPRLPYLAHIRVVIFGEEVAKEGIRKPLDFLSRNHEMRTDFVIVIAKGMEAKDQLKVLTPLEKIAANKIYSSIEHAEKNWAPTKIVLLDELISALVSKGKEPVISGLQVLGNPKEGNNKSSVEKVESPVMIKTDYIGVFNGDKLVGWLDENESKGFNFITDNITNTVAFIDCEKGGTLSEEVIRSKTNVKGTIKNGQPEIKVDVTIESDIADVECPMDLSKSSTIQKLEKMFNEKTQSHILSSVERAKELEADIFGFGEEIERANPKEWEKLKENWDEVFTTIDVKVTVDTKIRRMGTISESFQEEVGE